MGGILKALYQASTPEAPQTPVQAPTALPATPVAAPAQAPVLAAPSRPSVAVQASPPAPSPDGAILAAAAAFVEPFEGFRAAPYQDSVGVWTIGIGSTRDATDKPVTAHTPAITKVEALALCARDMTSCLASIRRVVKRRLGVNETVALMSFTYNVGLGNFEKSTMLVRLNEGDTHGAAEEFPKWNLAGGKPLPGLVTRRAAEMALFLKP